MTNASKAEVDTLRKRIEAEEKRRREGDETLAGRCNALQGGLDVLSNRLRGLEAPKPPPVEFPPVTGTPFRVLKSVGDWDGWHFGRIKEVELEGRRLIEMPVQAGDDPGNTTTRAQLETKNFLKEGETLFVRGAFTMPPGFPESPSSWGVNLLESYAERGDGSPPVSLQAREGKLQYRPFGGSTQLLALPLADYMHRRVPYIIGQRWATDGWVEIHIDDLSGNAPVLPRTPVKLVGGGSTPFGGLMRWIIQCYYANSLGNITLFHDNLTTFGHTIEEVL